MFSRISCAFIKSQVSSVSFKRHQCRGDNNPQLGDGSSPWSGLELTYESRAGLFVFYTDGTRQMEILGGQRCLRARAKVFGWKVVTFLVRRPVKTNHTLGEIFVNGRWRRGVLWIWMIQVQSPTFDSNSLWLTTTLASSCFGLDLENNSSIIVSQHGKCVGHNLSTRAFWIAYLISSEGKDKVPFL